MQRERFLHSDEEAPHIHIEDRIVKLLGDLAERAYLAMPAFANAPSSLPSPA